MIHHDDATNLPRHATIAALAFADPPYNRRFDYGANISDGLQPRVYVAALAAWIDALARATRPGGMVALLISEEWADDAGSLMTEIVGRRENRIVWYERFSQYTDRAFTRAHRHLFIHQKPGGDRTWNTEDIRVPSERMKTGDKRAAGPKVPDNVWQVRRLQGTATARVDWHPCQLPPEPLERLVRAYTNPGDVVAEQFAGSGSMALVASGLDRRYVGVDLNGEYVNKANERLREAVAEGVSA
jgi:DNA modification methylase